MLVILAEAYVNLLVKVGGPGASPPEVDDISCFIETVLTDHFF